MTSVVFAFFCLTKNFCQTSCFLMFSLLPLSSIAFPWFKDEGTNQVTPVIRENFD